jgi:hypothetical protein
VSRAPRYGLVTAHRHWRTLAGERDGLPSCGYGDARAALATCWQMRHDQLASGGADLAGRVVFPHRRHRRIEARASLWERTGLLSPRTPIRVQLSAFAKAWTTPRWCPARWRDVGCGLPTSQGVCPDRAFAEVAQSEREATATAVPVSPIASTATVLSDSAPCEEPADVA